MGTPGRPVAKLEGGDTAAFGGFGDSVAISGPTAVVGAPSVAKSAGLSYVFTKTASGWKQTAELEGSDSAAFDDSRKCSQRYSRSHGKFIYVCKATR
jgi:hypothetical protein